MKMRWTLCLQERDLEVEEFRVSFCDIFAIGREKNDDDDELTHIHIQFQRIQVQVSHH